MHVQQKRCSTCAVCRSIKGNPTIHSVERASCKADKTIYSLREKAVTKSLYEVLPNFAEDKIIHNLQYFVNPITVNKTAYFSSAKLVSFAMKKCIRHLIYWVQSSLDRINSLTFLIWELAILIAYCIFLYTKLYYNSV